MRIVFIVVVVVVGGSLLAWAQNIRSIFFVDGDGAGGVGVEGGFDMRVTDLNVSTTTTTTTSNVVQGEECDMMLRAHLRGGEG